jgi:4-aminobutyrate aminotransferase-like enzyme
MDMETRHPAHAAPRGVSRSLVDLLGRDYTEAVCAARAFAEGCDPAALRAAAEEQIDFYPAAFARRLDELVSRVGTRVCPGLASSARGAGSGGYTAVSRNGPAPLTGAGFMRIGEDGMLHLASKAEHYHLSLGHGFPGYRLVDNARRLGIPNATHNNTRGHVARTLEEELVAAAGGITRERRAELDRLVASTAPGVLNRVVNLETGSLVVEAALKMCLTRFYRFEPDDPRPRHEGRTPVFLVIGDYRGGTGANYHGTTILTQAMRGLWPGLAGALGSAGAMDVMPVRINDIADFRRVLREASAGKRAPAAFFHEIVLMNYGAVRLEKEYLQEAYALCRQNDVPTVADEIQSCVWSPELFLFREYGIAPDIVSAGKGFPGGEYPAARVIASAAMDSMQQFGSIVTNGQEELASLAFLVTIEFVRANGDFIRAAGRQYEEGLEALVHRYPEILVKREGIRHLSSLFFHDGEKAKAFARGLNDACIDTSVQSYKADCPPGCLTKLPLTMTPVAIDFLLGRMDAVLRTL